VFAQQYLLPEEFPINGPQLGAGGSHIVCEYPFGITLERRRLFSPPGLERSRENNPKKHRAKMPVN
jgi:hypothetical protein